MMTKFFFPLLVLLLFSACQNTNSTETNTTTTPPPPPPTKTIDYPQDLQQVFEQHGGLARWQEMNSLYYEIANEEGNEKQLVQLKDRRERIEAPTFTTGYDGKNFWVEADTSYKGNPVFYHNLIFYFYAMPFVVADEGINYSPAEPLTFEGKTYPGIKIAYDAGVGVSPEDEYFVHYDPQTHQMAWLGYTVTYFSKEKSKKIAWIRYDDWTKYEGLLLPRSMTWYKTEAGQVTEPRRTRQFENVKLSTEAPADAVFEKTPAATIVE